MKKAERILGIIATFLIIAGLIFKELHWPGAGVMMIIGIMLMNFGYLPIQLFHQWRQSKTRIQQFYCIFRFIAFFIVLTGLVFKLMHWPGAGIVFIVSSFLLPGYLILYFVLRILKQGMIPFMLSDLLITTISYGVYLYITTTMVSPYVARGYLSLKDRNERINSGLETSNNLIYHSIDSINYINEDEILSSVKELHKLATRFYQTTDSLTYSFYKELYGPLYTGEHHHRRLPIDLAASIDPGNTFFMVKANGILLKQFLDQYRNGVTEIASRHHLHSSLIGMGLKTGDFGNRRANNYSWEARMFENAPAAHALVNLSWIKQMALLTEANLLNGLISQIDLSSEVRFLQELASQESERAMMLKENEIIRIRQQQELQSIQLEQSKNEVKQGRVTALFAFIGIAFVLILLVISTRAYLLKQKDNRILAKQKEEITDKNDELNQQNEEISAQRDEIEAQRDHVSRQKEQIEKTHSEISASIDYATRLQASILSNPDLLKAHFSDHFILFKPRDRVSGDFYWWTKIENQMIIAAADCTGHGVPGALMSMLGISLLSEIVNKERIIDVGPILNQLRKAVIESLNQAGDNEDQKDGLDISLINIDTGTWKCRYAGANSPLYLFRKKELVEFKPDQMPVSIYPLMDPFTTHEIQLEKGDQLYLFSDGYADQFGGKDRRKFKYKAFKQLLTDHSHHPMALQHQILTETIVNWQGNNEQIDDMVVIGLKV